MPRPLFYLLLLTLLVLWARRFLRLRGMLRSGFKDNAAPRGRATPGGRPRTLVCGTCGTQYDPERTGWICPKCRI